MDEVTGGKKWAATKLTFKLEASPLPLKVWCYAAAPNVHKIYTIFYLPHK